MTDDEDMLEIDVGAALGADSEPSTQVLTLFIPDRDREGRELGNQRRWVLEAADLLARIGGGVTIMPAVEGGWLDDERSSVVWERPVPLFTFVKPDAFVETLPALRAFAHRLGRETEQGEVAVLFDGVFHRLREFD